MSTKALAKQKTKASARRSKANTVVMYLRTSSAANVGDEKDAESRRRARCQEHAANRSYIIMQEFKGPAVSGIDPLISRPGFSSLVAYCTQYGIKTILVESGDRFARDLVVQETGIQWLKEFDIQAICVDNVEQYTNPGCTRALVRHMLGAVNEFVAAQARERLNHGRRKALASVAADPRGKRSYNNKPKVGGPAALLDDDPMLVSEIKEYAKMGDKKRPILSNIAKRPKSKRQSWSMRCKNKGNPWPAKQIFTFLRKFSTKKTNTKKTIKKKPAARASTKKPITKKP